VQGEEESVGVGEPAEAIEGDAVLAVRFTGDAARVAGDQRDEEELDRPLRGDAVVVVSGEEVRYPDGERRRDRDAQAEREAAREAGDDDRGDQRKDERRIPVARRHAREDGERDLEQDLEQARPVVVVLERLGGPVDREAGDHTAERDRRPVAALEVERGQHDADTRRTPADADDRRPEREQAVAGVG
jgi:hypothetical protein